MQESAGVLEKEEVSALAVVLVYFSCRGTPASRIRDEGVSFIDDPNDCATDD